MASHDAPGSTLTVFSSMQGVRAPTDPSHWHAATRVLPRPADLSTHAERASSEEAVVCQLGGNHCCLDAERPLHRHTLPPCVRSNICQSSREGSWRHRWQWIRQTPIAAPRLASSSANAFFERAAGMSQHNQGSAQPRCCTSRVNRESARTGNIARPFVVTVDDVSPTQPPRRPGDCGPSRC